MLKGKPTLNHAGYKTAASSFCNCATCHVWWIWYVPWYISYKPISHKIPLLVMATLKVLEVPCGVSLCGKQSSFYIDCFSPKKKNILYILKASGKHILPHKTFANPVFGRISNLHSLHLFAFFFLAFVGTLLHFRFFFCIAWNHWQVCASCHRLARRVCVLVFHRSFEPAAPLPMGSYFQAYFHSGHTPICDSVWI